MSVETELYSLLTSHVGLSALVSNRVYPMVLPQSGTLPAVTYQVISVPRLHSLAGHSGLAHPRVQVNCWASSYAGAKAVLAQVLSAVYTAWPGAILTDLPDRHEPDLNRYGVAVDVQNLHAETI